MSEPLDSLVIYIDADACPVKEETYRVAQRYGVSVMVVANASIRIPQQDRVQLVVVDGRLDAADDWIAERAGSNDIVITADIPLASRCLDNGARVLDFKGGEFTDESIGSALASREILSHLRDLGEITGGPAPFQKRDRSQFLQRMDQVIQAIRRGK